MGSNNDKRGVMKRMLAGCVGLLMVVTGRAQTFAEWFQQNSTRLKYYGQQIAELQIWLDELNKGCGIAGNGLGSINSSKQGEYDLHGAYYASLGAINPAVGQLGKVAEMVELQAAIVKR